MKMDAVCLTHYHGDHIFGLPGLLQTLGCQGRTRPLALYGPKGLGEVWAALRVLTGPLPYLVCPEVLDAPAALCEKFGGWPQSAKLTPVPTRHRVVSQGYRLDLPRAGRFSPEQARALEQLCWNVCPIMSVMPALGHAPAPLISFTSRGGFSAPLRWKAYDSGRARACAMSIGSTSRQPPQTRT